MARRELGTHAHGRIGMTDKAKQAEYSRRYRATAKGKATTAENNRRYAADPEHKKAKAERSRRYNATPEAKAAHNERQKRRYHTPEGKEKALDMYRRRQYGMMPDEFAILVSAQSGLCAICDLPMESPQVDHCHVTGRVRGLLCFRCNTSIGMLGDNAAGLRRALTYLEDVA
jgi:hypothetical protein